jgi:hypothetical protein
MNEDEPVALKNIHGFAHRHVKKASQMISRWFNDEELGWCRVVRLGGHLNAEQEMEPILHYTYMEADGTIVEHSSSLAEVAE